EMAGDESSQTKSELRDRSPSLPVAVAFSCGIALDHALRLPRPSVFVAAGVCLIALFAIRRQRLALRVALLMLLYVALGAAAHHAAWHDRSTDSIARLLRNEPQLVRMNGTVAGEATISRRRDSGRSAAWQLED